MVCGSDVPAGGSEYTILAEHGTGVILDSVTPDHYGAAGGARLTIEGAGFTPEAEVELVRDGVVVATAATPDRFSGRKIAVDFDLSGLIPADDYVLRVRVGESEAELPFTVSVPYPAELRTNMILPSSVGYHRPATIWVEYENVGEVAMEAPLLVVSAIQKERQGAILGVPDVDPLTGAIEGIQARGFWTSAMPTGYANTVQFMASGSIPGLIQPGEKGRYPIYWAGWQKPWDFSYPDINFTLGVIEDTNTDAIDWAELKDDMQPESVDGFTWHTLWKAFTTEAGETWGSYVDMLQDNAIYLGRQGRHITDVSELLAFEFAQANGLNVVQTLAASTDAHVVAPGLDLSFSRSYGQSITDRGRLGDLGYGWSHNWEYELEFEADGTIRMAGPGGSRRTYQPDSRTNRPYFSMDGDYAVFQQVAGGYLHTESSGYSRFFNSSGQLSYVEDTNGNRITCVYSSGKLTRLEHSEGQFIDIDWAGDEIASVTDPDGRTTTYAYFYSGTDGASGAYLYQATYPDGSSSTYADWGGGLNNITHPDGTVQVFGWDSNRRLASISYLNGDPVEGGPAEFTERVNFTYGDAGEVYITDAFDNTSSYYLDHNGVLVRVTDPQGDAVALTYDNDYNLTSVIDPAGRSYNYVYDAEGNLTRMTDPLGYVTRLSYNGPFDRLTGLVDANGNITRYAYDDDGDLASITYDDGSVESWTYDDLGNPDSWTNRRGTPIGYECDTDGRLTAKVYEDDSRVEYHWDDTRGNLDFTVDADGTTDFTYDADDFLTRIDYPGGHWLEYTWSEAGYRTSLTNELGDVQYYHYDNIGRLESMTDDDGGLIVQYEYDAAGRLIKKTLGNDVYTTYAYNEAWELTSLSNRLPDHTILSQFEYEYDSRGRRIAMTSTYGQTDDPREDYEGRWTYDYDDLGQLIAWTDPTDPTGHHVEYEYDGLGNRITVTEDGEVTEYTTNNLNQYTQVGDTTYTFDLDGNMIREDRADGSWTAYTYNDENRLTGIETSGGELWAYGYGALGHRNSVTEGDPATGGVVETHIVDPFGLGDLVGVYSSDLLAESITYTHGFGLVNQQLETGFGEWFTFDAIGSVQEIVLDSGGVSRTNVFEPFGAQLLTTGASESIFGAYGAWGIQQDPADLLYMRMREYSPILGRFMASDPIGLSGGDVNLYRYVRNSPSVLLILKASNTTGQRNPWRRQGILPRQTTSSRGCSISSPSLILSLGGRAKARMVAGMDKEARAKMRRVMDLPA